MMQTEPELNPTPPEPRMRLLCNLFLGAFLAASLGTIAASFVPYRVLLARASTMSARGQVPFFDRNFYEGLQLRLRLIGMGNSALAGLGLRYRARLIQVVHQVQMDFASFLDTIRSAWRSLPTIDLVGLSGLTLFAGLLRYPLLFQPMRGDEAYTFITYAAHPFYVGLSFYNDTNNHLFNTLLVRLSYLLFGDHNWALRLPVFLAGLCLIPATYAASRCLYRRESALLAAGLVASSSSLIEYSTNARGYSLLCLEFMLLIPISEYAWRRQNSAAWVFWVALCAIGFYTMPTMLYPAGGLVIGILLSSFWERDVPARRTVKTLAVVVGLTALATFELYSPVFAISGPGALFGKKLAVPKSFAALLQGLPPSLWLTWKQWNRDLPLWIEIALLCGFFLALLFHQRLTRQRVPLAAALLLSVIVLLAAQRIVPFPRVWLFALPLYFVIASAGSVLAILAIMERIYLRQAIALVAPVACLFLGLQVKRSPSLYAVNEGRGMEQIALYLKGQVKAGDSIIAVVPSDTLMLYYFRQYGISPKYVNAPSGSRVFVVVNEHEGDTVHSVLDTANRAWLEDEPFELLAKYETACLYEVAPRQEQETSSSSLHNVH